jgi:D-arabinose 5-phosphate isomerase GutQ
MKKFNYIASAKRTFKIESDAIKSLSAQLDKNFENLCDEIRLSNGKFIIMGVGNQVILARKYLQHSLVLAPDLSLYTLLKLRMEIWVL